MGNTKAYVTTEDIKKVKKLIKEGWSLGYAFGLLGFKSSQQEYLYLNSQAYRNLKEWYRKQKGLKND